MMSGRCPIADHAPDVPVTRRIEAATSNGRAKSIFERCEYCAQGLVSQLVDEGRRVTVWRLDSTDSGSIRCDRCGDDLPSVKRRAHAVLPGTDEVVCPECHQPTDSEGGR